TGPLSADGVAAVQRPRRIIESVAVPRIRVPRPSSPPPSAARFGLAAVVAPLVMGALMAALFSPVMAVFVLCSPLMLLANWIDEVASALAGNRVLFAVPVTVDLADDAWLGIVGRRAPALALARSLVVQASTLHSPADLGVMVVGPVPGDGDWDWDWLKWLPHA